MPVYGRFAAAAVAAMLSFSAVSETSSEIFVDLKLDEIDYVAGERVRGVVDVKNISPGTIRVGKGLPDGLSVEVFRASDMSRLDILPGPEFTASFSLAPNKGLKLEVLLDAHYAFSGQMRYLARPVLVHGNARYEGQFRAFDIVPGMAIGGAKQMFSNKKGFSRDFKMVKWNRRGREHIFLTAKDSDGRSWQTSDLGAMMRSTPPVVSIMPGGEVVVLHRIDPDNFVRSEFWSMPGALEFHSAVMIRDPETAAQSRVQEIYDSSGGVKPADRPWWKFW